MRSFSQQLRKQLGGRLAQMRFVTRAHKLVIALPQRYGKIVFCPWPRAGANHGAHSIMNRASDEM